MVGDQVRDFFFIQNGEVIADYAQISEARAEGTLNAGVDLLLELIESADTYLFYAGNDGAAAMALFDGQNRSDGTVAPLTANQRREQANRFESNGPENLGGTLVGTNGRPGALHPHDLAYRDPVFAVIAYNTGAVQTQTGISQITQGPSRAHVDANGVPIEFAEQVRGLGKRVQPVSLFIHESDENLVFARMPANRRQAGYNEAHEHAIRR